MNVGAMSGNATIKSIVCPRKAAQGMLKYNPPELSIEKFGDDFIAIKSDYNKNKKGDEELFVIGPNGGGVCYSAVGAASALHLSTCSDGTFSKIMASVAGNDKIDPKLGLKILELYLDKCTLNEKVNKGRKY